MQIPVGKTNIPIAIVGMACRLPGADNLDQFWQLVSTGGSAVAELPHERLDQALYYHPQKGQRGKTYCKLGAILSNREFDRQACPIPPALEASVDNAHLLMCEVAAAACRQGGLDPFNLPLRNTGVYIGHAQGSDLSGDLTYGTCVEEAAQFLREVPEFQQLDAQQQQAVIDELVETVRAQSPQRRPDTPDVAIHMVAGTISKAFGLSGPFLAINSACASSLQAIQVAARALQLGRIDMAIVGGASDCKAGSLVLFSHAQSMSETGSRPFDAGADGLICSEGYVALVLKTLPRALADGDRIQAIIPGLGASCDGRGKSLWAPRKEGQIKAMERAYRNGQEMSTLQYIEAHATSTSLGDATELNALGEILSSKLPPGKKIPVTSVKANIGHTLEAAGISGVIKTVLCMQHRMFAPAINIESLNPKINWDAAPFYIPRQAAPWPEQLDGSPRRAGVNAFGIGGLNMHVILEEFTEEHRAAWKARYAVPDVNTGSDASDSGDAIAVIGMSCILPGASNLKKYWELVTSDHDPKLPAPDGRWRTDLAYEPGTRKPYRSATRLGGYITDFAYDWKKYKVPPKQVEQADPLQFMLLEAAEQALIDAGYDKKEFDRTRVAVLVGTEAGGDFGTQLAVSLRLPHLQLLLVQLLAARGVTGERAEQIASQFGEALLRHWPALIDESGSFSTSTLASRITKTMNLMGGAAAIDAGDASAAAALAVGADLLFSGDCDLLICAGGQRSMNLPQYEGMTQSGVLATSENPAAPFDAAAGGVVPGEGVGIVLLKRLSDARRDGDRVHAILHGIGGAHGASVGEALSLAIARAFSAAGIQAADVALLEMDGSGSPQIDQEYVRAILSTYGRGERAHPLLLGSVTGQIGHTMGASGMASLIKASLELEHGEMPRVLGLQTPLAVFSEYAKVIRAATARSVVPSTREGRRWGAVSSSSKRQAYHILLERGEKVPQAKAPVAPIKAAQTAVNSPMAAKPAVASAPVAAASVFKKRLAEGDPTIVQSNQPANGVHRAAAVADGSRPATRAEWRILRLGGATHQDLEARLQSVLANVPEAFRTAESTTFSATDRMRLAVVAESAERLAEKLRSATQHWSNPAALPVLDQQGCFYRQVSPRRPQIAFVFPGQGSQYAGMLRELVRDVPAAAATMSRLDGLLVERGFQTFAQMAWDNPSQLGTDIWVTQISVLLANLIAHAAVVSIGIEPDLISSHSYGEFAALTAARVWDYESAITAARARCDGIEATPGARGTMMATTAPLQAIEPLLAMLSERAYIANYNAPDQTILGGRVNALGELVTLLEARGYKSQLIPVPCPFHTPWMQGAGTILQRTLESLTLFPPRVPLLSSVTNRFVAEPIEIRGNLVAQLTTPVRYVDLVTRITTEHEAVLVEIGPQQALTRLNRRILEGRSIAGVIACDNPKRPGIEPLLHVRALLESVGALSTDGALPSAPVLPPAMPARKHEVVHVDATERRRDRMRSNAAQGVGKPPSGNGSAAAPFVADENGHRSVTQPAIGPASAPEPVQRPNLAKVPVSAANPAVRPTPAPAVAPVPAREQTVSAVAATMPAKPVIKPGGPAPDELEKFLINFVVEQTGYPPEVVELDADLEADLGIDSIKKAQLFGELAEYFDIQPNENMTLDDFPTLRHVLNFLSGAPTKVELDADLSPVDSGAMPVATPPAAAASQSAGPEPVELERFLINFVVEQTGYPPEVVELDADLEADLGIDSIKKAQLFGELAEYFDVQPHENMTLDDFPTLRHVLNFLSGAPTKVDLAPTPSSSVAVSAPVAAPAAAQVAAPIPQAVAEPASGRDPKELERFLITFVVEQTGYPPEVVELDADLEADLGIDSIKKAQLFGELAEYFDVKPNENMTLDDFPTLRHVLNFLQGADLKKNFIPSPLTAPETAEPGTETSATPDVAVATIAEPAIVAGDHPAVLRLSGTPYQMGFEHGRQKRRAIRALLRRFADLTEDDYTQLPLVGASEAGLERHFSADELDELQGMADAVGVSVKNLLAVNLAIDADFGSASSHTAIVANHNGAQGLIHAASQQLPLVAALHESLEPIVVARCPHFGHPHVLVSFAGIVGGLFGMNAQGLAVTGGMLLDERQRGQSGRSPSKIPARLLAEAHDIDSAHEVLRRQAGGQAWNACLSHCPTNRLSYVECDGQTVSVRDHQCSVVASNRSMIQADCSNLSEMPAGGITVDSLLDSAAGDGSSVSVAFDATRGDLWIRHQTQSSQNGAASCQFALHDLLLPDDHVRPAGESTAAPYDLDDSLQEATHRFVLRTIAAPLDGSAAEMPDWHGAALVVGKNPASDALRARLEAAGVVVRDLPISDDLDTTLAAFEQLWNEQPLPHLFIMTARDEGLGSLDDDAAWNRRRYRIAVLPYFLCQRWVQLAGDAKMLDRCTIVAATALGGDLGFSGEVIAPEGAALAALTKAIFIEFYHARNLRTMIIKSIDSPDDEPPALLAKSICREMASKTIDFEVAFVAGNRRLPYAFPEKAPVEREAHIRRGGTWVLTGGARGITAECALELGRRFGLTLHLIGASALPQIDPAWRNLSSADLAALKTTVMRDARTAGQSMDEAWSRVQRDLEIDRSLRAFSDAGIKAYYHTCDVADRDALARVLETIRQTSGPIEGIVHGAGIERACKYERKKREVVMATFGAKVDGAMNLMRLTRQDPVRHFIGFGSISGRMGGTGQTDYCLANDLLCKLVDWHRGARPGVRAVTFQWHPWDDVGMAARPEAAGAMRMADGPCLMPKVEGVRHFVRELYAGVPQSEVLITDWDYHGRYYGTKHHPKPVESGSDPSPADASPSAPEPELDTNWEPLPFERIASRHRLMAVAAPLPPDAPAVPKFEGSACILGSNPAALALRDRLAAAGVDVHMLHVSTSSEAVIAEFETVFTTRRPRYLFLMTGRDEDDGQLLERLGWQRRRALGLMAPFLVTQHWFRLRRKVADASAITIVAATALGGDFGLSGKLSVPEGGALSGLLKSLYIEDSRKPQHELRAKVVDAPADESPATLVDSILRELAAEDPSVEVGWSGGKRTVIRSIVETVESLPRRNLAHGGNWVVTGGARGITAASVLELARRFGLKLHLIGRSPVPQDDAPWRSCTEAQLREYKSQIVRTAVAAGRSPERDWEAFKADNEIYATLRKCAAAGVQATYYACDLSDWDRLAAILDEVRRKDGPIDGIVHGAGCGNSGRFESRSLERIERSIAGKLDGAVALMSLTRNDPVRYWVGFGSISGRFGGNGLTDYAAANDMLAKLIDWYRAVRPDCAACCMHWQSWDEIGMAMLGDSAFGTKGVLKMDFISPKEGVEHFCREVEAGLPCGEVLITDGFFERTFYPSAPRVQDTGAKTDGAPSVDLSRLPLVESIAPTEGARGIVAELTFDPASDPFLFDHKLREKPLLPAVISLEALAEAAALCGGKPAVALQQVKFIEGLRFHSDRKTAARVRALRETDSVIACELVSDFQNRSGKVIATDRLNVRGSVELSDARSPLNVPMPQLPTTWQPFEFQNAGPMYHGPTLQGVKQFSFDARQGWGQLIALPLAALGGPRAGRDWVIPATLVDAAFYVCGIHLWVCVEPIPALPQSIESVRLGRLPKDNEICHVHFRCRAVRPRSAVYDFTVFGGDRSTIIRVQGYECVMLKA